MAYATNQEVIDRLGTARAAQLTTASSSTTPDQNAITEAREGAEAFVNGYLAKRYQVPIDVAVYTHIAALLKSRTLDVVAYELHQRKPPVPEDVTKRYEALIEWLTAVAKGEIELPAVDKIVAAPTAQGPVADSVGPGRVFSRGNTDGL